MNTAVYQSGAVASGSITSITHVTVEDSVTDLAYNPVGKTVVASTLVKTLEMKSVAKWEAKPTVSTDPDNRLTRGADDGLYVKDDLTPDPLAYYILAKA
jgi:hypothetical protein